MPVDERAHEDTASVHVRRELTIVVDWSGHHLLNQGTGGDLAVNTNSRYISLHSRFGQRVSL